MGKARMTHTYYMYASIDKKSIYPYNQRTIGIRLEEYEYGK